MTDITPETVALIAAAVMEAAEACFWTDTGFHDGMSGDWHPISAGDALASAKASIRALITPDAMAALEAYRDREVAKALEGAKAILMKRHVNYMTAKGRNPDDYGSEYSLIAAEIADLIPEVKP